MVFHFAIMFMYYPHKYPFIFLGERVVDGVFSRWTRDTSGVLLIAETLLDIISLDCTVDNLDRGEDKYESDGFLIDTHDSSDRSPTLWQQTVYSDCSIYL